MSAYKALALDVGTSSVRAMVGAFDGEKLQIEENGRFYHNPIDAFSGVYWDMLGIYQRLEELIADACTKYGSIQSMSLDAWGTDMVALDHAGDLLTNGISTRDMRFAGVKKDFFKLIPHNEIYARTGIQFLDWNTLYLLYALNREKPWLNAVVDRWLFAPDYFLYQLTGEKICDYTIASTSQMLNPESKQWDQQLVYATGTCPSKLGHPEFGRYISKARISGIPVYSGCSHDTPIDKDGKKAVTSSSASNAIGILLEDVYVERPQGTVVYDGTINLTVAQTHSGITYDAPTKAALPKITFF